MRTTTRTLSAALLTVPLVAGATAPALAAPPERYSASGEYVDAGGLIVGELDGVDGNLHYISVQGSQTKDGSSSGGFLESWSCEDGVTQPWDPETGEELCDFIGFTNLYSPDATFVIGKKLVNGSISGTFYDVLGWECDDVEEECTPVYGDVSLDVDLRITSESTKVATSRSTQSFRDPVSGFSYRGTSTERYTQGAATGTVDGQELVDGYGRVGTYTFKETVRF
ncbi:hypothetical protein [Ornithinimicrobium cerasi]|uniref:Uncharacterized protein n=1 Tax=Ornithinimicrobium cerasi TaxID=2248773 RepID=A0A285VFE4_9MICO|nr:hypothetical protein [Ornithinimicrobium cerasi]SOC51251.1 hypothetical protein SAMN05421879_101103 [Ornithinimicrobium cerasi]